ncbi:MAG TPA: tetratricopeptide repeat protein [Blastocatellia bacterium]|nr:tetratricopeptide repeat protein [Blastocatellia bacterium]
MKLQEVASLLADKLKFGNYSAPGANKISQCPDEAELLSYAEKRVSPKRRARLEAHMADCGDCRETLVLFARISGEEVENGEAVTRSMSDDLIRRQTDKVLALIADDEAKQFTSRPEPEPAKPARSGFFVSYAQLGFAATLVIIAAVAIGYMVTDTRNAQDEGMQALASAIKNDRRINLRISGGFDYAPNPVTRGDRTNDELQFDIALNKLEFAEDESAPAEARLALARIYLSRDKPGDAQRALSILREISARAGATPELLNDTGVALYQLEQFPEAITAFSEALEKKPDFQEALFNRGLANVRAWFYNAARRDLQQFIDVTSDERWKQEAMERLSKLPQ